MSSCGSSTMTARHRVQFGNCCRLARHGVAYLGLALCRSKGRYHVPTNDLGRASLSSPCGGPQSLNHKSLPSSCFHQSDTCPSRDPSHEEAAGGALCPGQGTLQAPLEVPGEPAASAHPGEAPRHDPAAGDDRETPGFLRPSHDLQDVGKRELLQPVAQPVTPVSAVGKHLQDPRALLGRSTITSGAPSRSCTSAGCTCTTIGLPSMSTAMCRFRPLIFLPASCPEGPPLSVVFTD